jgi:hypothetical protein
MTPARIPKVEPTAGRRLFVGLVASALLTGSFWYMLIRIFGIARASSADAIEPLAAVGELLALLALVLALAGIARLVPRGWTIAAAVVFFSTEAASHLSGTGVALFQTGRPLSALLPPLVLLGLAVATRRLTEPQ